MQSVIGAPIMRHAIVFVLCFALLPQAGSAQQANVTESERLKQVRQQLRRAAVPHNGVWIDRNDRCVLDLSDSTISRLSSLKGIAVEYISLRGCKNITDLSPLKGMALTGLNLQGTGVTDLSPLESMPLKTLTLYGLKVKDLSPLAKMPLTYLAASGTRVEDLTPLKDMPLQRLVLNRTGVRDLRPLKGMPLVGLHLDDTPVTDLTPLKGMKPRDLFFQPERITAGINVVRKMKSIRNLGGGKCSPHFIDVAEFWQIYDHGHPVDHWFAAVAAGKEQYDTEKPLGDIGADRAERIHGLVKKLGDAEFRTREDAEILLKAEVRDIIPLLRKYTKSDDPEIRFRVGRIVDHLISEPSRTPYFAFVFQRNLRLTPGQWKKALVPWREKCNVTASHTADGRRSSGVSAFAQSFVPHSRKICAVELMIYVAYKGKGWIRLDLCADRDGRPSSVAMARTWIRIDTRDLPPHGVYLPFDIPDTEVKPEATYWITFAKITDKDSPTTGMTQYGHSRNSPYKEGSLVLPAGHVVSGAADAYFRVISKCAPVPLLRKATEKELKTLPGSNPPIRFSK